MRISKTLSILFFSSMFLILSTVIASDKLLKSEVSTTGTDNETRKPASVKKAVHWSATASEGFQYKIRIKQQLSSVWVLKRNEHYDLVFANSSGSRVNLSIPAEQFYELKNAAADLRAPASDTTKCKDNFVQIEVIEQKTLKSIEACLSSKGPQAEKIRQFGSALSALVR